MQILKKNIEFFFLFGGGGLEGGGALKNNLWASSLEFLEQVLTKEKSDSPLFYKNWNDEKVRNNSCFRRSGIV